jgi:plastocyanin/glucose/arabinose dehydrogenase
MRVKSERFASTLLRAVTAFSCGVLFTAAEAEAATVEVKVQNNQFVPQTVNVKVGDTVRWVWEGSGHSVTSGSSCAPNGQWNSDIRSSGASFQQTFSTVGQFPYFCAPHCSAGMTGTVIVVSADTTPPGLTLTGSDALLSLGETVTLTFRFSEPPQGFESGDIQASGGTLGNLTQTADPLVYTATFTQSGAATPTVTVPGGAYADAAGNGGTGASLNFTLDAIPPGLTLTGSDALLSLGETVTLTFRFSEPPQGFTIGDIQASGGTLGGLAQTADPHVFTATFTQSGAATPTITVPDGAYADAAGNGGTGASLNFTLDVVPPSLDIASSDALLSLGETVALTFSFSEPPQGFDVSDIQASGGNLGGLAPTADPHVFTATFTQSGGAIPIITVAGGAYTDAAGNGGTGASRTLSLDTTTPFLNIGSSDTALSAGETVTLTFTFSEPPQGFAAEDIQIAGGSLGPLTATANPQIFNVLLTQSGTVPPTLAVADGTYTDAEGNSGTGAGLNFTLDIVPPTLAITGSDALLSHGETVTVTFTFSEPPRGFDVSDIQAHGGTLGNLVPTADPRVFTVAFTQNGGAAPTVTVSDGAYADAAGNGGTGASLGLTLDDTPPSLDITSSDGTLSPGETVTLTFTFSEPPQGFESGDIQTGGGTHGGLAPTADPRVYTATFTQNGAATPTVTVSDGAYADAAGNGGTGASRTLHLDTTSATALGNPIPEPIPPGPLTVGLKAVATGLTAPNRGTFAPGDRKRLFVADQAGILWAIELDTGRKRVFGDFSHLLVPLGIAGPGSFDERGFLGVAFHPGYRANGRLYTFTSEPANGPADFSTLPSGTAPNHQGVVREWRVSSPKKTTAQVNRSRSRVLLRIDEPQFNHNGGDLAFGRDGLLYIALGDGGNADDQGVGHSPQGNGQDLGTVLGKILRIDPNRRRSANGQYGIPGTNPFAARKAASRGGQAGCQDGRCDEIYAYGFRNPFRFSFDRARGDLYVADVGQNDIEEVNVVKAGGNYGWPIREGRFCFDANGEAAGFVTGAPACGPDSLIDPVAQYDHDEGLSVIGGFVYRGRAIAGLRGRYVFGDYARTFNRDGRLFHLTRSNLVTPTGIKATDLAELRLADRNGLGLAVLGFGQDAAGELYVLGNETGVPAGTTGVVLKLVPADGAP